MPGRRCHGTPALSETHLWICRGRSCACCKCAGRATAADRGGSGPRAPARRRSGTRCGDAGRCRSSQARTSALRPSLAPAGALAPAPLGLASPPLGLAPASLGLAPLAPASLGLAPSLAPSSLVRQAPTLRSAPPFAAWCAADPGSRAKMGPGSAEQRDRTMLRIAARALHRVRDTRAYFARNPSISALNFSGASRNTRCPAFGITSARASGILAASAWASSAFWPIFGRSASGALGLPGAL
jgi:hypothetical protein